MWVKPKLRRIVCTVGNKQFGIYDHANGRVELMHEFLSDGGDLVSTGVDSRDGNTVGDDRKSSKTYNC